MHRLLPAGSSGLIGSEVVGCSCALGCEAHGTDDGTRAEPDSFAGEFARRSPRP